MFLRDSLISWECKKQECLSKSSTKAEYRAMSIACSKIIWLRGLLTELGFSKALPTPLHGDNISAIQIAVNLVFYEWTNHIEVYCHSIWEAFDRKVITLPHISTALQVSDIFTKMMLNLRGDVNGDHSWSFYGQFKFKFKIKRYYSLCWLFPCIVWSIIFFDCTDFISLVRINIINVIIVVSWCNPSI